MDLSDIQQAIETLPVDEKTALLDWLAARNLFEWDREIELDFSPGGRGMNLLGVVKEQVHRGESTPFDETRPRR